MQRGFTSLVLTLVLALAGMMFSACSTVETSPHARGHADRAVAASPAAQRHREATKGSAHGPVLREHRAHVVSSLSWEDDDDDDDELVAPFDTGSAPDDDDAAESPIALAESLVAPVLASKPSITFRATESRPRDPPRTIELPPPRAS